MSSLIAQARAEVVDLLSGLGVPIHHTPPARLAPPCILLDEGQPFIQPDTYGSVIATFHAVLVSRPGSNAEIIRQLDDTVSQLIAADPTTVVDRYDTITHANQEYLAAWTTITQPINH